MFETPYNPYWDADTETNSLHAEHLAMYQDCRDSGSFLSPGIDVPTERDENGNWVTNWDKQHPGQYSADRKKKATGEVMICTHQWRPCEEHAQWENVDHDNQVQSGWSEWSTCFAQDDESQFCGPTFFLIVQDNLET